MLLHLFVEPKHIVFARAQSSLGFFIQQGLIYKIFLAIVKLNFCHLIPISKLYIILYCLNFFNSFLKDWQGQLSTLFKLIVKVIFYQSKFSSARMEDLFIELFAGNIAGWSLVSTGMPLDLMKTKLQLNSNLSVEYFRQELERHGGFFRTFYRGASSMYLFIGAATALEFTVFETFLEITSKFNIPKEAQLMSSGFMAGMGSSMIYTPIQFAKIRTQLDQSKQKVGSARRMFEILKKYKLSGLKKIYTGLPYTIMKQAPGLGMYFGGFHVCMMDLFGEKDRQNAKITSQIGSAFIAGLIYNLWGYPFDTIKTNVQSGKSTVKSLIDNKFWKQKSYKQGMVICVMRGLIVDSTNLTVYERIKNLLLKVFRPEIY